MLRMPVPRGASDLEDRNGPRDLHQRDERGRGHDRGCRVHHDAQRAMIRVADSLVCMRNLRDGQKGEQNQAHNCNSRKSTGPWAAVPLGACVRFRKQRPCS